MTVGGGMPVVFRAPRSLRVLNVVAVASSLAACTSTALMSLFDASSTWVVIAGLPTLLVGTLWAVVLRWRKTVPQLGIRWGWFASVPLAALNSALVGATLMTSLAADASGSIWIGTRRAFIAGMVAGGTAGALFWVPALVIVLLAYGVPLARAQRLATRGLAGEERGEQLVGIVSALLGLAALVIAYTHPEGTTAGLFPQLAPLGRGLLYAFSVLAVACGGAALVKAATREARRRRFVARVEALEEPGFRVEPTRDGKVLLRVAPCVSYRVADSTEELLELDHDGRTVRQLSGKQGG